MRFNTQDETDYQSRRSPVIAPHAAVATSQPLATAAGLHILRAGGTAADAAVAVAAALQVTQPCSTGLGGDAFFLYYEADANRVRAYNGSGRSPASLTLDDSVQVARDGEVPPYHALTVTVPGACDAWCAALDRFGRLPLSAVLAPAIELAESGFPVAPITSRWWRAGAERQLAHAPNGRELMIGDRGPEPGERFRNPGLAAVLRAIADEGRDVFYHGWIAERIDEVMAEAGGLLRLSDLENHEGEWVDPIRVTYRGHTIWECPPNGQGLAALLALGTYAHLEPRDDSERVHAQVEAMRLGFADAAAFVADPAVAPAPMDTLLSDSYHKSRANGIALDSRMGSAGPGLSPGPVGDDTVYFAVADAHGNACSFINSNFMGFGTGIVPRGCGFSLQNRGRGFSLRAGHPNVVAGGKRPYHTIIPGMITDAESGRLGAAFGVMGGMMQPQGHLQVASAMIDQHADPQAALDAPRFQLVDGDPDGAVLVEDSMPPAIVEALRCLGHEVTVVSGARRALFGLGQVVALDPTQSTWWCGSDPRGDGHAAGF